MTGFLVVAATLNTKWFSSSFKTAARCLREDLRTLLRRVQYYWQHGAALGGGAESARHPWTGEIFSARRHIILIVRADHSRRADRREGVGPQSNLSDFISKIGVTIDRLPTQAF